MSWSIEHDVNTTNDGADFDPASHIFLAYAWPSINYSMENIQKTRRSFHSDKRISYNRAQI